MAKKIKLGGEKVKETLAVEIGSKTYNVPLARSMKRKELIALKDEESVFQMFAKYIPSDVLDDLTMDEYQQLAQAWTDSNEAENGATMGE